jgi:regulator of sigma E protease
MAATVFYFLVAIAILIFVHEYGHYRAALACNVKVLKFAIGFGYPLLTWRKKGTGTQFVIGALPLGGYVQMVDEREGVVDPIDLPFAFNRKSLKARAFIVAAGPLANLVLAVFLYGVVNWSGYSDAMARLASPIPSSPAYSAGIVAGDLVTAVGDDPENLVTVDGYGQLSWQLTRAAFSDKPVFLELKSGDAKEVRLLEVKPTAGTLQTGGSNPVTAFGLRGVYAEAVVSNMAPDGAASRAGLRDGDKVLRVDDRPIVDAAMLRELIATNNTDPPKTQTWSLQRGQQTVEAQVTPKRLQINGQWVGRVESVVGGSVERIQVRYGLFDGLQHALAQTYQMAHLTTLTLAKMVVGQASVKHISGPLSVADYAGKTAERGLESYLLFLAVISVSLGVLNLLPIPVLDGGHLMYYLWEGVTGKQVTQWWATTLQRVGVAMIVMLMAIGLFNDMSRIFFGPLG